MSLARLFSISPTLSSESYSALSQALRTSRRAASARMDSSLSRTASHTITPAMTATVSTIAIIITTLEDLVITPPYPRANECRPMVSSTFSDHIHLLVAVAGL